MTEIQKLIKESADMQQSAKLPTSVSGAVKPTKTNSKQLRTKNKTVSTAVRSTLPAAESSPFSDALAAAEAEQTWEKLKDFGQTIGQGIVMMADSIAESIDIVQKYGCDNIAEFNVLVNATNRDIVKFSDDYNKIQARHADKSGRITDPEERRLLLSIFEDYTSFNAYFQGTMHHTLVAFTDFSLQARDRAEALAKQEESLQSDAAVQQPTQEDKA